MQLKSIEISSIIQLVQSVGEIIMRYYHSNDSQIEYKPDNSPVTIADKIASQMIEQKLKEMFPYIPIISEENDENENIKILGSNSTYWLIDPIDGTKSYIRKGKNFTVNIALIAEGIAVWGIIYQPITKVLYYTDLNYAYKIEGVRQTQIHTTQIVSELGCKLVISHRNQNKIGQAFLKKLKVKSLEYLSSSLKFCSTAEGTYDLYFNFNPMYTWDYAAGNAILTAAGGQMIDINGQLLTYNQYSLKSPGFVAFSSAIDINYIKNLLNQIHILNSSPK